MLTSPKLPPPLAVMVKVNMTISLAFLAPDLVKAAIDGRLPHGMGVARLCDLPAEWSRQRQMLGLAAL
jgi:site-specific DNA recombinase